MTGRPGGGSARARAALGAALLALAGTTALAAAGRDPFVGWYYHLAWYPTLLAADAGLAWREGRAPWLGRPRFALSLLLWSIPAWLLFEAVNFRLANWYYVLAEPDPLVRRVATALAFATVLPAVFLAHRWMTSLRLAAGWRTGPIRWPARRPRLLLLLGAAFAALALWRPVYFFPLVWGSVTLLLEPFNLRRDPSRSLVADLAAGRPGRIVRLLAAGGAVGILWESFNALARTRWIYTVPWFEGIKLFEMPVPGYLGFPVFALDCFVVYGALVGAGVASPGWSEPGGGTRDVEAGSVDAGSGEAGDVETAGGVRAEETEAGVGEGGRGGRGSVSARRVVAAAVVAIPLGLVIMRGMDRWTVDSYHAGLADLPGAGSGEAGLLEGAGLSDLEDLARADPTRLAARAGVPRQVAARWVRLSRLAGLRGLGLANARALEEAGIDSACALADAPVARVRDAVRAARDDPHAGHPRRAGVWRRAAREACEEGVREERAMTAP